MDPTYLLKDELEFELACRGIELKSTAPVLRKLLTELLLSEQDTDFVAPKVKNDLVICGKKIDVLSNYVAELTGKPDKALFKRLVSRLYHVQNRLNLFIHDLEEDRVQKESLLQQCQVLLGKLERQDDIEEDGNLTALDKETLQNTLGERGVKIIQKLEGSVKFAGTDIAPVESKDQVAANQSVTLAGTRWVEGKDSRSQLARTSTFRMMIYQNVS